MRFSSRSRLVALLVLVVSPCPALADTVVEFLGRAADNGFRFYSAQTPWSGVRVGEYFYTSFKVTGPGIDITQPIDHQIQPLVQANVFNIVPGSFTTRLADISLDAPVGSVNDPVLGPISNPAALLAHYFYQVDTFDLEGVALPWPVGSCCYADGSCTLVPQARCSPGVWTSAGACDPNICTQPTGICCAFDNSCSLTLLAACSGTWTTVGGGGSCTPGLTCPLNGSTGSCCTPSSIGSCSITTQDNCAGPSTWAIGGACTPNVCPILIARGYAMDMYFAHHNPPVAWSTADFASIPGSYPGSIFDSSRSWLISFVGTDHNSYEMFIDVQKMVVSPDTAAVGSCCPGDGHCFVGTQAICPSTVWTAAGSCAPSPCPSASGACCFPTGTCDLVTPATCAATANTVYQGDGSSCAASSCGSTGACCTSGSCAVLLQGACVATGGSWLGAGATCATLPQHAAAYSITAGTCCQSNSCTVVASQYQCTATNAVWTQGATCIGTTCGANGACCNNTTGACAMATNGATGCNGGTWFPGTPCSPTPCPNPGACCNTSTNTCTIQNQASCLSASGGPYTWTGSGTCATLCGTGKCCSDEFGTCSLETQAGCAAHWGSRNMSWTAGQACDSACVLPITYLHGPSSTPTEYPISITDTGSVSEVEVWVDVYGPSAANLFLELVGPSGASCPLVNRIGASNCTGNFVGASAGLDGSYVFLDSAPQSIAGFMGTSTTWVPAGAYKPAGCGNAAASLNTVFGGVGGGGASMAGNWKLRVTDYRGDLRMYLRSWGISFNGGNPAPCTVGHCTLPQGGCTNSTFAQCSGNWSIGPCSPTNCTSGTPGACCYLNGCTVICQSLCPSDANGGRFGGSGTTCTTAICRVACCTSSGACSLSTTSDCGGSPGPVGSTCSPNTCPQPAACCQTNGACTLVLPGVCSGIVGSSTCSPNTCPGQPPAPPNDVCSVVLGGGGGASAEIVLVNGVATINDTLVGATSDGVTPSCGQPAADAWYRFTPPATAPYIIKTCGSFLTWDSLVSVWSNCTTQLPGACGDNGCSSSNHASLTFTLNASTPYLIRVGAFSLATPNIDTFRLVVSGQGACCTGNAACPNTGICYITDPASCANSGGTHQGLAATCSPNPCPQVLGMCCLPSLQCFSTCQANCEGQSGTFGGIGVACGPANPCPIGVCCRGATCATGVGQFFCQGANAVFLTSTAVCHSSGVATAPCCHADYNKLGGITVQDIFDFLTDWFNSSPYANTGGDGNPATLNVQNIFDFLGDWFAGGC